MKNQTTSAKYNKSEIFKAAWAQVKKLHYSLSHALKNAWETAKKSGVITVEKIVSFSNSLECCNAWANGTKSVQVSYRAKKSDRVYIDMEKQTVSFSNRAVATVAGQIAKEFNFTLTF